MPVKTFRTLALAKDFHRDCVRLHCPSYMRDQLLRASLSVVNNLSEGSAKSSPRDRARFYQIALASFRESQGMLDLLNQASLLQRYDFLGICLFNLHRYTLTPRSQSP